MLVNVNMVDQEKAEKNVELKKKKPEYKPYEEEESVDDMVTVSSLFCFTDHVMYNMLSSAWACQDIRVCVCTQKC